MFCWSMSGSQERIEWFFWVVATSVGLNGRGIGRGDDEFGEKSLVLGWAKTIL